MRGFQPFLLFLVMFSVPEIWVKKQERGQKRVKKQKLLDLSERCSALFRSTGCFKPYLGTLSPLFIAQYRGEIN